MANDGIDGMRVCRRAPVISHLLFADDSLLFFRATGQQAQRIRGILEKYCRGTGQSINYDKCSILFNAKQEDSVMDEVKNSLNIHRVTFEAKYLGLPTPEGRMKADCFQAITERLSKRCNGWDERCLSAGGKDVLIKSVAQAIPVYVMSVFLLPGPLHEGLTRVIRKFWWGETRGKRKTHWIAWDKFTKAKGEGGLGFRDLKIFNQALLARQAWRLIDRPESLCARVLKAKYFPNGNLFDTAFPVNQSATWKAIVHGLELLKKGICWRVGSGNSIRVWRDPWIPRRWTRRPAGKRRPCQLKWVAQLIDQDRMQWKEEVVRDFFRPHDVEQILNIRLPSRPAEDFMSWLYEKTGVFSVKSAYKLARDLVMEEGAGKQTSSGNQEGRPLWKEFWKLPVPHKVAVFGWRVINNGLATQENKKHNKISLTSTCEVCGMEDETVMHALIRCGHAITLRAAMREVWKLPEEEQLLHLTPMGLLPLLINSDTDVGARLLLLLWRTWYVRNNITHNTEKLTFAASIMFLQRFWAELCDIRQQQGTSDPRGKRPVSDTLCIGKQKDRSKIRTAWEAPQQDWVKINVDGALDSASGDGGIGIVIRNSKGEVLLTAWQYISRGANAEEVEAMACKEGLVLAAKWCRQCAILETDCASVAAMLAAESGLRSGLKFVIDEALEAGRSLPRWRVVHRKRESNGVAHELAQLAKRTKLDAVWHFAAPVCVEQLIARECNHVSE
jgi:ribonuclease HI